ncbi:MAG: type 4a pilus biogenesis protein PilO [Burkholderiales bacterium]
MRSIDFESLQETIAAQFRGLNPNEPGQWPLLPKSLAWAAAGVLVIVIAWFTILSGTLEHMEQERAKEEELKTQYSGKLAQAINLDELRKQKLQVEEYVTQLERQLPGKAEMDALLSDINQAGLGRGLQFELFRPGQVIIKDYYAELPIALRVTGRFHDIGAFAADIANLSRIVTLHNLVVIGAPLGSVSGQGANVAGGGQLAMEATARTYRYLDPTEMEANRQAAQADKKKAGGGKP